MLEKLRTPFKKLIDPIARFLVSLHLSANAVTIIGAVGMIAAALITGLTGYLFAGAVVMTILVLFDSLDGSVAALTGGGTAFGAFLDSTLDRMADWAMLICVALYFALHTEISDMWTIIGISATMVALMTSFLTPYTRARAEAVGFEAKNGIAARSDRVLIILVSLALVGLGLPTFVLSLFMILLSVLGIITVAQRIRTVYVQSHNENAG
ncbi:phosphatidylinositol phosphate synthase [Alloscardovia criceti]|uniref:phosphatidylinositol phosphate synthase n=1 Tax=Alloscardovia criceti TaxID=356828 RepID=UPI00037DCD9C|nr:CDP-alcohol phosphatidyltransferase family protein [Alloscardovia criceti]